VTPNNLPVVSPNDLELSRHKTENCRIYGKKSIAVRVKARNTRIIIIIIIFVY